MGVPNSNMYIRKPRICENFFKVQFHFLSESSPYRSRLAVGSSWYDVFFNRWKVVFREVFLIIEVKLVRVQPKHGHHGIMPCTLRLYHHFVQGLLHCYMVLVTKRVMYGDIF